MVRRLSSRSSASGAASSSGASPVVPPRSELSDEGIHHYSLDGLADLWDSSSLIRERLRSQHNLCRHFDNKTKNEMDCYVERSVHNLKCNKEVISPVLKFMWVNDAKVPSIDRVIEQVTLLYKKAKCAVTGDKLYHEGWAVRRLCAYLKTFAHKPYLPKDRFCSRIVSVSTHRFD